MKKHILAVAILSASSSLVLADDLSYGNDMTAGVASTIDLYQIPFAADGETAIENAGGDTFTLTSGSLTQMNIVTGTNGGANEVTVDQSAATASIANVFINAQVVDTTEEPAPRAIGAGNAYTGRIADITTATDGIQDQQATDSTTLNTVTLTQSGTANIAGIAVAGESNTVTLDQSGKNTLAMISNDGHEMGITLTQASDNAVFNVALHSSSFSIIANQ